MDGATLKLFANRRCNGGVEDISSVVLTKILLEDPIPEVELKSLLRNDKFVLFSTTDIFDSTTVPLAVISSLPSSLLIHWYVPIIIFIF